MILLIQYFFLCVALANRGSESLLRDGKTEAREVMGVSKNPIARWGRTRRRSLDCPPWPLFSESPSLLWDEETSMCPVKGSDGRCAALACLVHSLPLGRVG